MEEAVKSLVTGATGFIGSHLVEALQAAGDQVRALVRPTSDTQYLERLGVERCIGDLTDPPSLARAVEDEDRVFHCGAVSTDWDPLGVSYAVNVEGTAALAEGWPYCDTKIEAEKRIWEYHQQGLPVTVLRPATVYGPRCRILVIEIVETLRSGQMMLLDRGRKTAGLCYVTDLTDLMLQVGQAEVGLGRVYNVADGAETTWAEFINGLAALMGLPPVRFSIPRRLAYSVGWLMEKWAGLRGAGHRPLLTRQAVETLGTHQGFSIDRARRELGFEPKVFLEEGLRLTGEWLRAEGYTP
jgi:nucleoside-diphosphate-sugar epimerase